MGLTLWLVFTSPPVCGQESPLLFYLGLQDSNGNGQIESDDALSLYAADARGVTTQMSATGERVLNYRANNMLDSAAYVLQEEDILSVIVVSLDGTRNEFPLEDVSFAIIEHYSDTTILLSGQDEDDSLIVVIDIVTGEMTRRALEAADAQVSFDSAETFALVYSISQTRITLYRIPLLEEVPVIDAGGILSSPVWSPSVDSFAFISTLGDTATSAQMAIISPVTGALQTIDLMFMSPVADISLTWSATGRFITISANSSEVALFDSLIIVDIETGNISPLQSDGQNVRLIDWSPNDRYALLSQNTYTEGVTAATYALFTPADGAITPLDTINFLIPNLFQWRPDGETLGILGMSLLDEQSGFFELDPVDQALSTRYISSDPVFAEGGFVWVSNSEGVVLATLSQEPIDLLMGVNNVLSYLNASTGELTRLTPNTIAPLPFGLQLR